MTYKEAMEYIRETAAFGSKLGLDNIRTLMNLLGDPQEELTIIHIAGTNGKGSVSAYILSIMEQAGYRMGFYTSPELSRFSERIRINEEEISDEAVAYYATMVRNQAEYMREHCLGSPSEFELVLAMAFCFFKDKGVDGVILEVGLGGRLDATNVISRSALTVITKIGFDHMQYLGDTLELIASEKAAIIKPCGRVIVYPGKQEVMEVYEKRCAEQKAELYIAGLPSKRKVLRGSPPSRITGQEFVLSGRRYITAMAGTYEAYNAALAIQAIHLLRKIRCGGKEVFGISDECIYEGVRLAKWPGRFEILSFEPMIIVDGAHNEDGAEALAETVRECFGSRKFILCTGILRDKQYEKMLSYLLPLSERVIVCEVPNPRSLGADELAQVIHGMQASNEIIVSDSPENAYETIKKLQHGSDAAVLICGSLYLVGPMREIILKSTQYSS